MQKKYQVFVSSTYKDLKEVRRKVIEVLLLGNYIPVGMEYFPASNDEQMEVIKRYIDECDYYILVIGDRYGSVNPKTNKSYIQMEYEYAEEKGIPICAFIKKNQRNCKKDKDLTKFCDKIKPIRMCGFWKDENELALKILKSLSDLKNRNPQGGWVRYNKIAIERDSECLKLKKENEKLLEQICFLSSQSPQGTECFQQGEDEFTIHYEFIYHDDKEDFNSNKVFSETKTWNQIFLAICNLLLQPVTEAAIEEQLEKSFLGEHHTIVEEDFQTILVQLMALKLINVNSIEENGVCIYWMLTPYGRQEMVRLKAIKKLTN